MRIEPDLVLASMSPRRRVLVGLLGVPFTVAPSGVDESLIEAGSPQDFARRAAEAKCLDIAAASGANAVVIGADTVVHFISPEGEERMLGKPTDAAEAITMLRALSGRVHEVTTGVAVSSPGGDARVESATTRVRFRPLSDAAIEAYVATGESLDKAGSYALQGRGGDFIEGVEGDLQNVIGLPMRLLVEMLRGDFPSLSVPDEAEMDRVCRSLEAL